MSDSEVLRVCNELEQWLQAVKPEDANEARDIWDMFSALMEGYQMCAEYADPLLKRTKVLLERMGDLTTARYVELTRLKGSDAQASEWDTIRNILHLIFNPKSGGGWAWAEIKCGKFEDQRGRV